MNPADPDYYAKIKLRDRWYLIVPEPSAGSHEHCAFYMPEKAVAAHALSEEFCKLQDCRKVDPDAEVPEFERWDCGENATVFVAPSKFSEYLAARVAQRMNE